MQNLRKIRRDKIISVTHKDLVGVYYADTDGSETLIECTPKHANKLIRIWNQIVEDELEENKCDTSQKKC